MNFSVLMSVYGKDNVLFFEKALQSVTLDQTLKPKQVVIVQDGPVPCEIDAIIASFQEQLQQIEFTVLKKEMNDGLAAALNSGLTVCKYEWIARMDSDDISVPERFEKQVNMIAKNPSLDVVGGAIAEFENEIGDIQSERHVGLSQADIKAMAKSRTPMNHMTVFYKKSSVLNVGGYSENFGKLEDYKLWVDMLSSQKTFANLDDILVYVRIGNGFIERRSNKREIRDWDMLQKYLFKNGFIGKGTVFKNQLCIRMFIYMPGWMKKLAYKTILRT